MADDEADRRADDEVEMEPQTDDEGHHLPRADQPYNAPERRPLWRPLFAVIAIFVAIALVFAVVTWVGYNT